MRKEHHLLRLLLGIMITKEKYSNGRIEESDYIQSIACFWWPNIFTWRGFQKKPSRFTFSLSLTGLTMNYSMDE